MMTSTSNNRRMATTPLSILPEEMEMEVLLRLPVKSILRFSAVCRRWAALLSSDEFCSAWTQIAESKTTEPAAQLLFLPFPRSKARISTEVRSGDGTSLLTLDGVRRHTSVMAPKPCRGLTLLHDLQSGRYHVFNAATRVTSTLPLPPFSSGQNSTLFRSSTAGLGFDTKTKEYKVVRLFSGNEPHEQRFTRIKCKLYTLGSHPCNLWMPFSSADADGIVPSMLAGDALLTAILYKMVPVFVDGFLHWLVHPILESRNPTNPARIASVVEVLSFSVGDETFSSCVRPPPFNSEERGRVHLTELDGRLCMVRDLRRNSGLLEIWNYSNNGGDCWSLEHQIDLAAQHVGRDDLIQPLHVRVLGCSFAKKKVIFIATSGGKVLAYDTKSGNLEIILEFGGQRSRLHNPRDSLTKVCLFKESLTRLY